MYIKSTIITSLAALCIVTASYAQNKEAIAPVTVQGHQLSSSYTMNKTKDGSQLNSKEISQEVSISKGADIFIENTSRPIEVKTWDQSKVKILTTVFFEGDGSKVSDEEWFEKLNLTVKSTTSSVRIKLGTAAGSGSYTINGNSFGWSGGSGGDVALFNGKMQSPGSKSSKRIITIYLPKENKLDIESKYADVTVSGNVNRLNVDITNGNLEVADVNSLILRSKYGNVNAGNIKTAEIEFLNGHFTAKDIDDLDIDTKYATIDIGSVKKTVMRSVNDEYEFEQVGTLQGRKNYGNLRITKLTGSFDLDGTNADVKLRSIEPSVTSIKFDDKYADLRIPLRSIKNYNISFAGPYSSVYSNFEKVALKEKAETKTVDDKKEKDATAEQIKKAFRSVAIATGENNIENNFTATGGDGKGTKIDIKCQNCTVDFK